MTGFSTEHRTAKGRYVITALRPVRSLFSRNPPFEGEAFELVVDFALPAIAGCHSCGQGRVYRNPTKADRAFYGHWSRHRCPRGVT